VLNAAPARDLPAARDEIDVLVVDKHEAAQVADDDHGPTATSPKGRPGWSTQFKTPHQPAQDLVGGRQAEHAAALASAAQA
jgi:hypothetical protein